MTKPLRHARPPARILEVGAGTGAITGAIVRHLRPDDRLDVVEINPRFVELLTRRLRTDWHDNPQVRIIQAPIQNISGEFCYDYIISGLPLNIFPTALVRQIFATFKRLAAAGATLTFFEYTWIRQLKSPFVNRCERRRLYRVGRIVGTHIKECQIRREYVLANIPPATVRHLRLGNATPSPALPASPANVTRMN